MGNCKSEEDLKLEVRLDRVKNRSSSIKKARFSITDFVSLNKNRLKDEYSLKTPAIGKGAFSQVFKAVHIKSGETRAVKMINKSNLDLMTQKTVLNEINILKSLDHPNIVKIYEFFENESYIYIVMELIKGDELFKVISDNKYELTEQKLSKIMKEVFTVLYFIHGRGIVHRDIKSENMIFDGKNIVIIDFGVSKIKEKKKLTSIQGTALYMAPEVIDGKYDEKCDMWSAGILLYILLTGEAPYKGDSEEKIFANIKARKFKKPLEEIKVFPEAVELLRKLLEHDPQKRISASEALKDKWINNCINDSSFDFKQIVGNLKDFQFKNKLQEGIYSYFVNAIANFKEQKQIIETFKKFDLNNDGLITYDELKLGLEKINTIFNEVELKEMFLNIDTDRSGTISYSEYFAAAIKKDMLINEESIIKVFKMMDLDKSGKISIEEFKEVLSQNNDLLANDWKELIRECDINKDGEVV